DGRFPGQAASAVRAANDIKAMGAGSSRIVIGPDENPIPPGAGPDRIERSLSFDIKPFRVDSLKRRKIPGQLSQSLSQLQFGACPVPPPVVIEADGEMNHRLEKQPRFAVS